MLAAHRDQENMAYSHQTGAAAKQQLQNKTPGARYPKTPLKIPLNDENATRGLAGKSARPMTGNENLLTIGKGVKTAGKSNMATPLEPRTNRAPLGNKTTNAKARTGQPVTGVKDLVRQIERTNIKPTTIQRPKQGAPQIETSKLEVHTDKDPLEEEEEVEYAPPKVKDLPYESDVLPENLLTFEGLKRENMFRGYYQHYFQDVDDNGVTQKEREIEDRRQQALKKGDEQIWRDNEDMDWGVGDVPGSKDYFKRKKEGEVKAAQNVADKKAARLAPRPPSTLASRKAASALANTTQTTASMRAKANSKPLAPSAKGPNMLLQARKLADKKPAITRNSSSEHVIELAASRTTIGYSKGRSAASAIHARSGSTTTAGAANSTVGKQNDAPSTKPRTLQRTVSTASSGSDVTITPARFARDQATKETEMVKKPDFLSIFDVDEEEDGPIGGTPEFDDLDDGFELPTNF